MIHHDILSNVYTGERWEGDCIDEAPCGWGDFYNSDNIVIYSGFRYGDKNICYGTYFYPDILNGKIQFVSYKNNYITLSFNNVTFTFDKDLYQNYYSEYSNHSFTDNTVTINGQIRFENRNSY